MSVLRRFRQSVRFAVRGLVSVFREEQNFRIQLVVLVLVLSIALLVQVRAWEFVAIVLAGGSVLVLECVNSAVEHLLDLVQPRLHGYVRDIKDIMAAAVLIVSIGAALIGFIILLPYFSAAA